jgi:hypothetical protein
LDLGYCLTGHKAEGMTIKAEWDHPAGARHRGTVLVWGPGMDAAGGYVAVSRAAGDRVIVAPLEELEGERERLLYGTPADQDELSERVIAAIEGHAQVTQNTADDRPVLVDLGQAPSVEDWRLHHDTQDTAVDAAQKPPAQAEHEPTAQPESAADRDPEPAVDQDQTLDQDQTVDQGLEPVEAATPEVGWEEQHDRWGELADAVYAAERSCDPDALYEAFEQR